ncbi:MAG: hypothetical protein DF168_00449 [Candidatus Moanabacter tarae]|uniref:TM2 domain-containing protein n=1 Tax=Candidatus Moanibacter tarae TaxID=2200854 RepID=A0A2Z4AE86_9BACT|nr:MAG: hypothetical protein DF168_00449 [Candidatus Moanabacter tarae]|tara:strand:- start:2517 stop:2843 length:327 start_codon:yes stop_codon:yes gene_type:complete
MRKEKGMPTRHESTKELVNSKSAIPIGDKKIAAGICGILLGALGVHKFIIGCTGAGMTMLLLSIFGAIFFGWGPLIMGIIGMVEGIIYLTRSNDDFSSAYIQNQRNWF